MTDRTPTRSTFRARFSADGLHFFNRETGANVLVDEISVPTHFWARAPRNVSIALTNACDLACPHCYAPKHRATLGTDSLYEWLGELDSNQCLGIGFGGGEPTLVPYLTDLCRHVAQNTRMAATFTTHGHWHDRRLAQRLRGHVHFIRVSMDGIGPTYEQLRGRSFPALLQQIKAIRDVAPFGINYVVNEVTVAELDRALELAVKLGATEFLLLPQQPTATVESIDQHTVSMLSRWSASVNSPIRVCISDVGVAGISTCRPFTKDLGLRAYAHIDAGGYIRRSSFDRLGVAIDRSGVMLALEQLRSMSEVIA
ncbi:MAG: radical SAM protein [Phycisphaerae bacterium]|nr:radical SAM protein [Phycisphaerae bacterium]